MGDESPTENNESTKDLDFSGIYIEGMIETCYEPADGEDFGDA